MIPAPSPDAAWRRTNLGHLLFAATAALKARKLSLVHAAGFEGLTDTQLAVLEALGVEGGRLTDLAARVGTTAQSAVELVDRAERQDLVERAPEVADRRAKQVTLTERGRRLRMILQQAAADAEREFAAAVGSANVATLRRELSIETAADVDGTSLERALAGAARRFVRQVLSAVHEHGYHQVTEALLTLFRTMELKGSRLTEVATAAGLTKQSMRALVTRAEALGFVERVPERGDGRAKTIRFTETGLVMLERFRLAVAEAEGLFAESHGDSGLIDVKAWLTAYLEAVRRG